MTVDSNVATRLPAPERGGLPSIVEHACPLCRRPVRAVEAALACVACGARYPIVDGVPDFEPASELYWGELSRAEMDTAIERAEREGYDAASQFAASRSADLHDYLLKESRVDWLFHAAGIQRGGTCLDVGSGWGTLSRALVPFFDEVWSLEIVRQRLVFQNAFRRREGLDGLRLARGSAIRLPFADASFDLVVGNGIIQWVGLADHARPVPELQDAFLAECRRVLRPDGVFVMGCENRFGFFHWLGARDHTGLRYTSLLPRRLAGWVVRRYRRTGGDFVRALRTYDDWKDYRTYTHSVRGYERLVRRAGFASVTGYWAYPANNIPGCMGRVGDGRSLADLLEFSTRNLDFRVDGTPFSRFFVRLRRAARLTPATRLILRTLTPDLFVIARPRSGVAATLERAVGDFTVRWSGSNKMVWFERGPGRRSVVKHARFPKDEPSLAREERLLGEHNGIEVAVERHGRWVLYREPYLEGRPLDCLAARDNDDALGWLAEFQGRTARGRHEPEMFAAEVARWLERFREQTTDEALHRVAEEDCRALLVQAARTPPRIVAEHGDFWRRNILRRPDGTLAVIDWQHAREAGDEVFDFALLAYTHWETWNRLASRRRPGRSPVLETMLERFCGDRGLPPALVYAYFPYALMRRMARSLSWPRYNLLRVYREHRFPRAS